MGKSTLDSMGIRSGADVVKYIEDEAKEIEEFKNRIISILKSKETYHEAGEIKGSLFDEIGKIIHKICYMPIIMYDKFAISGVIINETQLKFNLTLVQMNLNNFLRKVDVIEKFDWGFSARREEHGDLFNFVIDVILVDRENFKKEGKELHYEFSVDFHLQHIEKIGDDSESHVTH